LCWPAGVRTRHRAEWLAKISEAGVRRRAEFYYQHFDALAALRQQARRELLAESREHFAVKLLRQIPSIGPIRAALLVALIQTPPPLSHQAPVLVVYRSGAEDLRQW